MGAREVATPRFVRSRDPPLCAQRGRATRRRERHASGLEGARGAGPQRAVVDFLVRRHVCNGVRDAACPISTG